MTSNVIQEPPHCAIFDNIMAWGEDQADVISWAWLSPGGWEGWTQVELQRAFNYHATREDNAYSLPRWKRSKRTDFGSKDGPFVMGPQYRNAPQEQVLLELKCEGSNNRAKFKDGVQKDIKKIMGDVKEEWWIEGGCTLYSIALSMSANGHAELQELGMRRYNQYPHENNPPFQLYWTMRYIPPDHFSNPNSKLTFEEKAVYTQIDHRYAGAPVSYDESEPTSDQEHRIMREDRDDPIGRDGDNSWAENEEGLSIEEGEDSSVEEGEDSNVEEGEDSKGEEGEDSNGEEGEDSAVEEGEDSNGEEGEDSSVEEGEDSGVEEGEASSVEEGEDSGVEEAEDYSVEEGEDYGVEDGIFNCSMIEE